jgi:hypothetical protein
MLRSIVLSLLLCATSLANDRVQITTIHEGDRVSIPKAGYVSFPFSLHIPAFTPRAWFIPTPTRLSFLLQTFQRLSIASCEAIINLTPVMVSVATLRADASALAREQASPHPRCCR